MKWINEQWEVEYTLFELFLLIGAAACTVAVIWIAIASVLVIGG